MKRDWDDEPTVFWVIAVIFFILGFFAGITFAQLVYTEAAEGHLILGDEHLGGFMYVNEVLAGERILEPEDPYNEIIKGIMEYELQTWELTDEARDILYRIVEAEATGGNIEQKKNVASCVLSRVRAPQWPDTVKGVVFQSKQFSPVWDGRYYTVTITESTKKAVDWVLKYGETHDCLWFCSDGSYRKENSYHRLNHTWSFYDGEHHYFYD